ncbi:MULTISPECIES: hypothetical protein [Nguyenibacter]|uniref:Uncharacterized protein n=1 Tax=Nguyenibacter vanlangensis TaxID=1216886 RepID=A0A7Y7ISL9_9PROT|nr:MULTISPECIES: hypothetical protein [Nguyenibacter]NVN09576.1 hypothetical protein [Nguyenibacter vanlangensis]WRH89148.1 hypothetical protein QN315_05845 [Nguyenibacter sp. L1]
MSLIALVAAVMFVPRPDNAGHSPAAAIERFHSASQSAGSAADRYGRNDDGSAEVAPDIMDDVHRIMTYANHVL